jgi:hypothetical protein
MNLYSTRMFPEPDIAYSLHHGLMLRMADRNYDESKVRRRKSVTMRLSLMRAKTKRSSSSLWPTPLLAWITEFGTTNSS